MDPSMPPEVHVEQVAPRPIAAVRRRARESELSQVIPAACGEVWKFIQSTGMPHSGLNMALYLDLEMNLEIGVIVHEPFASEGDEGDVAAADAQCRMSDAAIDDLGGSRDPGQREHEQAHAEAGEQAKRSVHAVDIGVKAHFRYHSAGRDS